MDEDSRIEDSESGDTVDNYQEPLFYLCQVLPLYRLIVSVYNCICCCAESVMLKCSFTV